MHYETEGFVRAEDGTRLFFGESGSGPAVVLCDGIGCDGYAWEYLQPRLAPSYRVVHWHYRGHGRSGPPTDPARTDIYALARDLQSLVAQRGLAEVVFIGHSMGVQVILEHYRLYPNVAHALVLVCGSPGRVTQTFHGTNLLHELLPSAMRFVEQKRSLTRALWGWIPPKLAYRVAALGGEINGKAMRREDFARYWTHMALMEPELFLDMLRSAGEHSAEDVLSEIRIPTLVVAADRDTFTPPHLAQQMADAIPNARHVVLSAASHAAPVEVPEAFNDEVLRFLATLPPRTETRAAAPGA